MAFERFRLMAILALGVSQISVVTLSATPVVAGGGARSVPSGLATLPGGATDQELLDQYWTMRKEMFQQFCPAGEDAKYDALLKAYRGEGYYLPETSSGQLDSEVIRKHLPAIRKKYKWIRSQRMALQRRKRLPAYRPLLKAVQRQVQHVLELKKKHRLAKTDVDRQIFRRRSGLALRALEKRFNRLLSAVPFLLNPDFPVNHFAHRRDYEWMKTGSPPAPVETRNDLFFQRRIHEDGAYDPDHTNPDVFLRTALDMTTIQFKEEKEFLSENMREDLEWILDKMDRFLRRGHRRQVARLREWETRTLKMIQFYSKLISNKKRSDVAIQRKQTATFKIKDFVLDKQAAVYKYLAQKPEYMRVFYVFEEILFNEMGHATVSNYPDRVDIAHIVMKRTQHPFYSSITPDDSIYPYLTKHGISEPAKHPWLNVMFKEGEFSFTYFYIPSVSQIFCPDQSRRGQYSRRKNVILGLKELQKPNPSFLALRYFSRQSMLGKIDMREIWKNYEPLPERPGRAIANDEEIRKRVREGKFRFFYHFTGDDGGSYDVIEIDGRTYVVSDLHEMKRIFQHRNPHRLRAFKPKGE